MAEIRCRGLVAVLFAVQVGACGGRNDMGSDGVAAGGETSVPPAGGFLDSTSEGAFADSSGGSSPGAGATGSTGSGSTTVPGPAATGSDGAAMGSTGGQASIDACFTEWTFDTCPGGWQASPAHEDSEAVSWACGDPSVGPELEPGFHAGMWGTSLDGAFPDRESSYLTSPSFDLSACAGATIFVEVEHWGEFANGCATGAGGFIELSADGGATWIKAEPFFNGYNGTITSMYAPPDGEEGFCGHTGAEVSAFDPIWLISPIDLSAYGGEDELRIRFVFGSRFSSGHAGWYIDRVTVEAFG